MPDRRPKIDRLNRLVDVRQVAVDACERNVRDAQRALAEVQARLDAEKERFFRLQAFFAQPAARTGLDLRQTEAALEASRSRQVQLGEAVDKARSSLTEARARWMEARRDRKVAEKLRERQLQDAVREMENVMQKATDEVAIIRHRRTEFDH